MTRVLDLLRQLRSHRRDTVRALSSLTDRQLTARTRLDRSSDVRSILLSLTQDDDRRCVAVGAITAAVDWWPTEGQRILAGLGRTRGYLRAVLVGLADDQLDVHPAADEWGVRQTLRHVINNENRFVADVTYALDRLRGAEHLPIVRPDPERVPGGLGPPIVGGLEGVVTALEQTRDDVALVAADLTSDQLDAPTTWAGQAVEVRFMLYRRATHERQHTVQVQKALRAIAHRTSEAQMLLGHAEMARGALEGMLLGVPDEIMNRDPGNGMPSFQQLMDETEAVEQEKVTAVLDAVG